MTRSEVFLNKKVAVPPKSQVWHVLAGHDSREGIGSHSGRIKPYDFIASVGATTFFLESPDALAAAAKCVCEHTHSILTHSPGSTKETQGLRLLWLLRRAFQFDPSLSHVLH